MNRRGAEKFESDEVKQVCIKKDGLPYKRGLF